MKVHLSRPSLLIQYTNGSKSPIQFKRTWDGRSLLTLGFPTRFVLQQKNDQILVRDFSQGTGIKNKLKTIDLGASSYGKKILLSADGTASVQIDLLQEIFPIDFTKIREMAAPLLDKADTLPIEDQIFQKYLKRAGAIVAVLFLAITTVNLMDKSSTPNEELIPKKFAKIIMTKPKETKTPAAGATASQAQVKAIARAFKSKTVQQNMRSILKGGLSKYSIMATGKSIQNLAQKVSGNTNVTGANLQGKASDILAANNKGNLQIGSDSGYGAGAGVNVKGQGHGQVEIGLSSQDATVDEGLSKDEVARVIHSHISEIRFCYESALLRDASLAGKVLIDFKISPSGIVQTGNVSETTITDRQVGSCLVGKLKSWKFPQPLGGVIVAVSYPFNFKSLSR